MNQLDLVKRSSDILRRLRLKKDVTQDVLSADLPHLSKARYQRLEKGNTALDIQDIFDIAEYHGMNPSDLVALIQCSDGEWVSHERLLGDIEELKKERAQLIATLSAAGIQIGKDGGG
jgi:transcriptional regulator with XRE-family HTH domain